MMAPAPEKRPVGRPRIHADHILAKSEQARRHYEKTQTVGHRLNIAAVEQVEPGFVRIVTEKPHFVFRATLAQAAALIAGLTNTINSAQHGAQPV